MQANKELTPTSIEGIFTNTPEVSIPNEVMDKAIICKYFLEKTLGTEVHLNVAHRPYAIADMDQSTWWLHLISNTHYLISMRGAKPTPHVIKGLEYLNAGCKGVSINTVNRRAMKGKEIVSCV